MAEFNSAQQSDKLRRERERKRRRIACETAEEKERRQLADRLRKALKKGSRNTSSTKSAVAGPKNKSA